MGFIRKLIHIIFPIKNYIFFESKPDFADNARAVFEEIRTRGYENHKFIWWVNDRKKKTLPKIKNVVFVDKKSFFNRLIFNYYNIRAKTIIYCNLSITKYWDEQKMIYLGHGSPLKSVGGNHYVQSSKLNFAIAESQMFADRFKFEEEGTNCKIIPLGYARTDVLCKKPELSLENLFNKKYNKVIVWYPTFRQNIYGANDLRDYEALPLLNERKDAVKLQQQLKEKNVLLVLKPHFSQDVAYIKDWGLDNLVIINDEFYVKNNTTSYEFIAACDALISDYSSVYYDFLLCDKPIGVIWNDIERYSQKPGFSLDPNEIMAGAEKIYTLEEFCSFINSVASNIDSLKDIRNQIKNLVHFSTDGKCAKRVVDFFENNNVI